MAGRGPFRMSKPDVGASVIVPVLNEEAHIERSIDAALTQRFERGIEVLVVDGGSEDGTGEVVARLAREDPRIRVLSNPRRLIPNGLNIGLRHARGEYVARMDAHTYYPPDYVALGVARLEAGGVQCVGGPQVPYGEDRWSRRIALALRTRLGMGGASFRNAESETEVDTVYTGVWRRATLLDFGGWDESWPINEDSELAARIREAGGTYVCLPAMAARYVPRRSLRALAVQYWKYGKYREKTARHHPIGLRRSHVLPPAVVLALLGSALARGRARLICRRALLLYGGGLVAGTAEAATIDDASGEDLLWLPAVFAAMHLSWGAGFLVGCVRFGLPVSAFAGLLRPAGAAE